MSGVLVPLPLALLLACGGELQAPPEQPLAASEPSREPDPKRAPDVSFDYDAPPKVVKTKRPKYPRAAFDKRIEGTVLVEILIDEKGRVARTRVIQSVPGLDEAALDCMKGWRFAPARRRGKAVATLAHAPVTFKIER